MQQSIQTRWPLFLVIFALGAAAGAAVATLLVVRDHGVRTANERLVAALQALGATVDPVPVYRWALPEDRRLLTT